MWRENLTELKKAKGMTSKQIAEICCVPEKTVVRIFNGSTPNPTIDNILAIVRALGGSLDIIFELFAGTGAIISDENLVRLQAECDALKEENTRISQEIAAAQTTINDLTLENRVLQKEIDHKQEIIDVYRNVLAK